MYKMYIKFMHDHGCSTWTELYSGDDYAAVEQIAINQYVNWGQDARIIKDGVLVREIFARK